MVKAGINDRPIPGKLKKRFEPYEDKSANKNNDGSRKLGKPNDFGKNGNKKAGQYKRKVGTDETIEVLYDEKGNRLNGKYNKEKQILFGEELYDQYGNKFDRKYKKLISDEPYEDL